LPIHTGTTHILAGIFAERHSLGAEPTEDRCQRLSKGGRRPVAIDIAALGLYLGTAMRRNLRCPTCGKTTPDASFCEYCGKPLYSCKACGTTIAKEALFCPDCGKAVTQEGREMKARERVSWAWWLLPVVPLGMALGSIGTHHCSS
jgi:hypothetical protein